MRHTATTAVVIAGWVVAAGCGSGGAGDVLEAGVGRDEALASLARHGVRPRRDEGAYGLEGDPPTMRYAIDTPAEDDLLYLYFTRRPVWMPYRLERTRWYHDWREGRGKRGITDYCYQ